MNLWKFCGLGALLATLTVGTLLAQAPTVAIPSNRAILIVQVHPDATVTIGGYTAMQRGASRWFITPELNVSLRYEYQIEASWNEGGLQKKAVRRVEFQPGGSTTVDLLNALPGKGVISAKPKEIDQKPKEIDKPKVVETKPKEIDKPKKVVETKPKEEPAKQRRFVFTYGGTVKGLKPGQNANVWLPLAETGPEQHIGVQKVVVPGEEMYTTEKQYGNKILYFQTKANAKGEIPFEITYGVRREEVKTNVSANLVLQPSPQENLTRFLAPDVMVPITGKPLELIADKKLPKDQFAAAKVLYEVVNTHMKYSKAGTGWGQGDSVWACDSKFGNCSDFHSLFISMARGNKIPSKFEMGFPIPAKRGSGEVGGYHCWAWFLPDKRGWVPVDISEANRNPEMKEYYFGNLTEDRVRFSTGRDINLEPRQKGSPLNFFIYPYVEVDGKTYPQEKIERRFTYRDVQ